MTAYDVIQNDYCFIFVCLLMLMPLHLNKGIDKHIQASFWRLIMMAVGLFIFKYLSAYLVSIPQANRWCTFVSHLKYAIKPILLWQVLMISERESLRKVKILLTLPLLIFILILAVSFPFNWICYHKPITNVWCQGPLLPLTWIVLLIYMALIMLSAFKTHFSQDECFFLLLGEGFILFNIIVERFWNISIPGMEHAVIILCILIYYLYFCFRSVAEYKLQKEKELSHAQIQAMISQIKPHFIYNSLACIAETCHQSAEKGEEAVLNFSAYLRSCFQSLTDDGLIPFNDELNTIKHYIELEQMQAPGKLTMQYNIEERDFQIPVLSIETLVENAVKHGIRKKHGNGNVLLKTERDSRGIVITIEDDGIGFDTKKQFPDETHLGIKNARLRLADQCSASLQVHSRIGQGTTVTIIIPDERSR